MDSAVHLMFNEFHLRYAFHLEGKRNVFLFLFFELNYNNLFVAFQKEKKNDFQQFETVVQFEFLSVFFDKNFHKTNMVIMNA